MDPSPLACVCKNSELGISGICVPDEKTLYGLPDPVMIIGMYKLEG